MKLMRSDKIICMQLEEFLVPFKKYVKDIDMSDYDILINDFNSSNNNTNEDWSNKDGKLSIKLRDIIKKYFKIKLWIHLWHVPNCAGGIFLVLNSNQKTLEDIVNKLKLDPIEYPITKKKKAIDAINSLYC